MYRPPSLIARKACIFPMKDKVGIICSANYHIGLLLLMMKSEDSEDEDKIPIISDYMTAKQSVFLGVASNSNVCFIC